MKRCSRARASWPRSIPRPGGAYERGYSAPTLNRNETSPTCSETSARTMLETEFWSRTLTNERAPHPARSACPDEGPRRHIVHGSLRGRSVTSLRGGASIASLGRAQVGDAAVFPEPTYEFGPRTRDELDQYSPGLAYDVFWRGLGEPVWASNGRHTPKR